MVVFSSGTTLADFIELSLILEQAPTKTPPKCRYQSGHARGGQAERPMAYQHQKGWHIQGQASAPKVGANGSYRQRGILRRRGPGRTKWGRMVKNVRQSAVVLANRCPHLSLHTLAHTAFAIPRSISTSIKAGLSKQRRDTITFTKTARWHGHRRITAWIMVTTSFTRTVRFWQPSSNLLSSTTASINVHRERSTSNTPKASSSRTDHLHALHT